MGLAENSDTRAGCVKHSRDISDSVKACLISLMIIVFRTDQSPSATTINHHQRLHHDFLEKLWGQALEVLASARASASSLWSYLSPEIFAPALQAAATAGAWQLAWHLLEEIQQQRGVADQMLLNCLTMATELVEGHGVLPLVPFWSQKSLGAMGRSCWQFWGFEPSKIYGQSSCPTWLYVHGNG